MKDITNLRDYCREISIELTDRQLDQFQRYYELLIKWNEKMNLTSITEFDDVLKKHFLDSLSLVKADHVDVIQMIRKQNSSADQGVHTKLRLLDIGTGAGFPAIPLKIVFPNLSVVMLDSLNKRINFLNEVIKSLELNDIIALHGRAEDYAKFSVSSEISDLNNIGGRESFDLVVSRAVANLSTLSEYCLPYVKINGIFAAYKSEDIEKEQKSAEHAISILGGRLEEVFHFILPYTEFNRSICIIRKIKTTPKKYPRKAGTPAKEPL